MRNLTDENLLAALLMSLSELASQTTFLVPEQVTGNFIILSRGFGYITEFRCHLVMESSLVSHVAVYIVHETRRKLKAVAIG